MENNIFSLDADPSLEIITETIAEGEKIVIERSIFAGQSTPEGEWYDQDTDEWVILLKGSARLGFSDGSSMNLQSGDHLFIEAHKKHRVEYTSKSPECVWLSVHAGMHSTLKSALAVG